MGRDDTPGALNLAAEDQSIETTSQLVSKSLEIVPERRPYSVSDRAHGGVRGQMDADRV